MNLTEFFNDYAREYTIEGMIPTIETLIPTADNLYPQFEFGFQDLCR